MRTADSFSLLHPSCLPKTLNFAQDSLEKLHGLMICAFNLAFYWCFREALRGWLKILQCFSDHHAKATDGYTNSLLPPFLKAVLNSRNGHVRSPRNILLTAIEMI